MCADDPCVPLCSIFNQCLSSGQYPKVWKNAEIMPVEKNKSANTVSDFRPISLLWHLGKVFEKAIMYFYVDHVLPDLNTNQFAYQKGKSTVDALLCAIDFWTGQLDKPDAKYVTTAFLDMSKAFDRMDRGKLIDLLMERNINDTLVNIVNSFLSDRYQTVRLGHATSSTLSVANGTPQGTLLGPMFWLLYVDNLDASCKIIKYADDLTMIGDATTSYQSPQNIQSSIDIVSEWCDQNNMLANAKKSNIMHISNKRTKTSTCNAPSAILNGETIPTVKSSKFLGIAVDEHLSFEQHVQDVGEKIRPLTYVLLSLKRSGIPVPLLVKFYISCIRSKITYATPAWFPLATSSSIETLTSLEKLAIKIINPGAESYHDRLQNLSITPLKQYQQQLCHNYVTKVTDPTHCLNELLPKHSSTRHSERHQHRRNTKCRTKLRERTLFYSYVNADCIKYA